MPSKKARTLRRSSKLCQHSFLRFFSAGWQRGSRKWLWFRVALPVGRSASSWKLNCVVFPGEQPPMRLPVARSSIGAAGHSSAGGGFPDDEVSPVPKWRNIPCSVFPTRPGRSAPSLASAEPSANWEWTSVLVRCELRTTTWPSLHRHEMSFRPPP